MSDPTLPADYDAVVLDIEGTTTSISFVYDELFPFARAHVKGYLEAHWDDPSVEAIVQGLRRRAADDLSSGDTDAPQIPEGQGALEAAVANVHWQMDRDRKTTALKALQGRIWVDGYERGELLGHLFDDVPGAITAWIDRGCTVHIYSSGSVAAQKLLFGYSVAGDLTPSLSGYFDTGTGGKKEADSYREIAAALGLSEPQLLFVTDSLAEAEAARQAGVQAVLSVRPGNPELPEHSFPIVTSLTTLAEAP